MSTYTEQFTEVHELLANLVVNASAAEQNTGYVEVGRFHRVFVQVIPVLLGDDLEIDFEQATDTLGTGVKTLDAGSKDTTILSTETGPTAFEIHTEEFDVDGGFDAVNVEVVAAAQGASSYVVQVWGCIPRNAPVATTLLEAVIP